MGWRLSILDLTDAIKKISHAKRRGKELQDAISAWENERGLLTLEIKDDELAKFSWFVSMPREPAEDLPLIAGDVFGALRDALDFVAWQIYLAGGGRRDDKQANRVYFPISVSQSDFHKQLKGKIPNAWPESVERLLAAQPFNQPEENKNALLALHSINNPSKHRELSLIAAGLFSHSATFRQLPSENWQLMISMTQPGPVLKPGGLDLIAKVAICRPVGDNELETVRWSEGVTLDQPPQPQIFPMFANGNGEIAMGAVPALVAHVEALVGSFASLEVPEPPNV